MMSIIRCERDIRDANRFLQTGEANKTMAIIFAVVLVGAERRSLGWPVFCIACFFYC